MSWRRCPSVCRCAPAGARLRLRATDLDCKRGQGQEVTGHRRSAADGRDRPTGLRLPAVRSRRGHPVRRGWW